MSTEGGHPPEDLVEFAIRRGGWSEGFGVRCDFNTHTVKSLLSSIPCIRCWCDPSLCVGPDFNLKSGTKN